MEQKVTVAGMKLEDTKHLPHRIEICLGMPVMVTLNLATEADLANGSRGVIHDIVLDPRENTDGTDVDENGIVRLRYPPAMIIFRPFHFEFEPFPGFEPGLIPLFPSEDHFNINYRHDPHTKVFRRQYPLCAAYAFTDHKGQGQTMPYVIVDIAPTK
jgi:ATP-dependent exoDNAse (exonuclease V) alpha subunit